MGCLSKEQLCCGACVRSNNSNNWSSIFVLNYFIEVWKGSILIAGVKTIQIETDFYIGIDQDAKLASRLVRESAVISRYIYLPKPLSVIVEQVLLESNAVLRVRLKAYVLDTVYEKQFVTDVTLRVQDAFAEHQILPPEVLNRAMSSWPGNPQKPEAHQA